MKKKVLFDFIFRVRKINKARPINLNLSHLKFKPSFKFCENFDFIIFRLESVSLISELNLK